MFYLKLQRRFVVKATYFSEEFLFLMLCLKRNWAFYWCCKGCNVTKAI